MHHGYGYRWPARESSTCPFDNRVSLPDYEGCRNLYSVHAVKLGASLGEIRNPGRSALGLKDLDLGYSNRENLYHLGEGGLDARFTESYC